ncbi:chromate transporter [Synechocystis sp. LKSZ1]|uniref:chromate transporter n=1 Tax=Synechocystis sp. LKSZ1 TaxID=3144951 RepID=UPI00336C09DC
MPQQPPIEFDADENDSPKASLVELAQVFLRLGFLAFGGPAAHIAMMDEEVVQRRRWLSREKLLDLLGVTNLIPGPNSTELAIHIGYEQAGVAGLMVAGACFILPAMVIVWLLAMAYVRYQAVPQVDWLLYGVKPVILAVIIQALYKLGQKALKDRPTIIAAVGVVIAAALGGPEIGLILLAGLGILLWKTGRRPSHPLQGLWFFPPTFLSIPTSSVGPNMASTGQVFLYFLKIGSVLYGSGYVLLAFLQRDLVERLGWLTSQQLLDAIAIGQVTPGPVFTTATFIGYLLAGNSGALAGTIGIFLPSFVFVFVVHPWVTALRKSVRFSAFLDGVNAASLGLMAVVTFVLARSALVDSLTIILAGGSALVLFRFKVNSAWLVLAGGAIGLLTRLMTVKPL